MTAQRTPGPWGSFRLGTRHYIGPQVEGNVIEGQCIAMVEFPNFHPDGLQAAAIEADANAVFIVTACDAHDALVADNARLREALESIEHHAALILGENSNERETLDAYIDDFDDSIVPPDWATPDKLRAKIGRLKFYVLGEARAALAGKDGGE